MTHRSVMQNSWPGRFSFSPNGLPYHLLVVRVVREVVQVMFDGHEQTGQTPAAPELRGENHAGDEVFGRGVG